MKNYIQSKNSNKFFIKNTKIQIKDEISKIPNKAVIQTIVNTLKKVPSHLLKNVHAIYVGQFETLKNRELQAMYKNSEVFLNNEYEEQHDMVDDLVHEIAHSVEDIYGKYIYSDGKIEEEFIEKRKKLWQLLKNKGIELDLSYFLQPKYNKKFDFIIYKDLGYPVISALASNLFYSPYAVTSLSEYFANGFEAFFMKEEIARLKKISPELYLKLINLLDIEEKT